MFSVTRRKCWSCQLLGLLHSLDVTRNYTLDFVEFRFLYNCLCVLSGLKRHKHVSKNASRYIQLPLFPVTVAGVYIESAAPHTMIYEDLRTVLCIAVGKLSPRLKTKLFQDSQNIQVSYCLSFMNIVNDLHIFVTSLEHT